MPTCHLLLGLYILTGQMTLSVSHSLTVSFCPCHPPLSLSFMASKKIYDSFLFSRLFLLSVSVPFSLSPIYLPLSFCGILNLRTGISAIPGCLSLRILAWEALSNIVTLNCTYYNWSPLLCPYLLHSRVSIAVIQRDDIGFFLRALKKALGWKICSLLWSFRNMYFLIHLFVGESASLSLHAGFINLIIIVLMNYEINLKYIGFQMTLDFHICSFWYVLIYIVIP